MGILNALDVALQAGIDFMMFFREFWQCLPLVVQALAFVCFGLMVLLGLMRMMF